MTVLACPTRVLAGVEADVEAGVVFVRRNDTRIPGDKGTDLSLVHDLSTSAAPVFRLRLGYRIAERHLIPALYAPLQINAEIYPYCIPLFKCIRFNRPSLPGA
jgi:hypothetical protein